MPVGCLFHQHQDAVCRPPGDWMGYSIFSGTSNLNPFDAVADQEAAVLTLGGNLLGLRPSEERRYPLSPSTHCKEREECTTTATVSQYKSIEPNKGIP